MKEFYIVWTQFWNVNGFSLVDLNTHKLSVQLQIPAGEDISPFVETVVGTMVNSIDVPYGIVTAPFVTYTGKTGICIIKNDGSISVLSTQVIPQEDLIYINMCW